MWKKGTTVHCWWHYTSHCEGSLLIKELTLGGGGFNSMKKCLQDSLASARPWVWSPALGKKKDFHCCPQDLHPYCWFAVDAHFTTPGDVNKQFSNNTLELYSPLNGFHEACLLKCHDTEILLSYYQLCEGNKINYHLDNSQS
jgi:hypothetical protein